MQQKKHASDEFQQVREEVAKNLGSGIGEEGGGDGEEEVDLVSGSDDEGLEGLAKHSNHNRNYDYESDEQLPVGIKRSGKQPGVAAAAGGPRQAPAAARVPAAVAAATAAGVGHGGSYVKRGRKGRGWEGVDEGQQKQGGFYVANAGDDKPGLHAIEENYATDSGGSGDLAAAVGEGGEVGGGGMEGASEEGAGAENGALGNPSSGRSRRKQNMPQRPKDAPPKQQVLQQQGRPGKQQQQQQELQPGGAGTSRPGAVLCPSPWGAQGTQDTSGSLPGSQMTEQIDMTDE
jgi:hypothetical protein